MSLVFMKGGAHNEAQPKLFKQIQVYQILITVLLFCWENCITEYEFFGPRECITVFGGRNLGCELTVYER